ncbi:MAG: TIGR04372 family glycosyltransferase [Elusimicrobia bacterium]|nr:TIGR04372 family glycosyltransferase [Elusimicrobiota bacterium]
MSLPSHETAAGARELAAGAEPSASPPLRLRVRLAVGLFVGRLLDPVFRLGGWAVYALLRAVEPVFPLTLGLVMHGRIGHLIANTDLFLRKLASGRLPGGRRYVLFTGRPANDQILGMIKRRIPVARLPLLGMFFNQGLKPLIQGTRFHVEVERGLVGNEWEVWEQVPPQLSFAPEEERRGAALLAELGIPAGEPFVCFHSRDPVYLDLEHPYNDREGWSYQDYRDCSIENYLPAAEALARRGRFAVRMGFRVAKALPALHPRVIDYATRLRSDLGDVYLPARCKFFLGSTAGLSCVPICLGVPVALANIAPVGALMQRKGDLFIPKLYRDASSGRALSFPEIVARGLLEEPLNEICRAEGVEPVENTADDIRALAEEMDDRLDGRWAPEPGDEELQARFRGLFPRTWYCDGFRSRIGAAFLRRHADLLG